MTPPPPIRWLLLIGLALGCSASARAQGPPAAARESSARAAVEKLIRQSGADVSLAFRSLDGAQELFIAADTPFEYPAAMKIPVMIELYARVDAHDLRWSDSLALHSTFRSVADGSPYRLDSVAPPDIAAARTMTLRQLCDVMMTRDSDLAADLLIEKLGLDAIRQRMRALGADGMDLVAGFGDTKASAQGLKNVTSARALMVILWGLANDRIVSADASQEMMGLIARSGLPVNMPGTAPPRPAVRGPSGADHHAATIIIGAHSFVLVTNVRGLTDPQASAALVARIAHAISRAM